MKDDPRARSEVLGGWFTWTWTSHRTWATASTEKTENDLPVAAEGTQVDKCVVALLRGAPKRRSFCVRLLE